jgi:hypothetical protein
MLNKKITEKIIIYMIYFVGVVMNSNAQENGKLMFIVEPNIGIGPIKLGMSREDVRKQFNGEYRTYKHGSSKIYTDTFFDNSFQVSYNEKDTVEYIELSGYKNKYFNVMVFGFDPFKLKVNKVEELLNENGIKIFYDNGIGGNARTIDKAFAIILPEYEISMWREMYPESQDYLVPEFLYDEYGNGFYWLTIGIGIKEYFVSSYNKGE